MKKIEPAHHQFRRNHNGDVSKWMTAPDPHLIKEFGYEVRQLYTDDALQVVAETVLSKVQEEINKHVILDEESRSDIMFNRGLDKADAIVGDFDIVSFINQLKGQ